MPFIYEIDSPDVCPPGKAKGYIATKRSIRAHNAVVQKVGRAHSRRTNERTFVSAGRLWMVLICSVPPKTRRLSHADHASRRLSHADHASI